MPLRIENTVDLHCHFGPDSSGGKRGSMLTPSVTGREAAQEARDLGQRALVLKSHSFCSCQMASSIQETVPGVQVFGGACTDHASGGLNADIIDTALALGAKIIWLPTINSCADMSRPEAAGMNWTKPGIPVIDEDGKPNQAVKDIFALVKEYDAVLATGHTTREEQYAVCRAFGREGKVLVTHACEEIVGPKLTIQETTEFADLGAMVELTASSCMQVFNRPPMTPQQMIEWIDAIGPERCTLSSDCGFSTTVAKPAPGLKDFLETLWVNGVSEANLARMASANPSRLLNLE